jgi:hypothetical protein
MSYERFAASIEDGSLAAVAAHWHSARKTLRMPAWRAIDPSAIKRHLPKVWAWRFDAQLGTFIGRLAGEEIIAVLGTSTHGKRIDECFPAAACALVLERYKTVIGGPSFMHSYGKVFLLAGGQGVGERIVLPLAEDGIHGDGVIGATVYRLAIKPTTLDKISIDHQNEIVDFYPLD